MTKLVLLLIEIKSMDAFDLLDLLMDDKALLHIPTVIHAVDSRNKQLKNEDNIV